jgi:hypothetical protein
MATRHSGSRSLSLALQAMGLRHVFPKARTKVTPTRLTWTGRITPTPLSRSYEVRITYSLGSYPRVFIVDPPLEPNQGGILPHFYREGTVCLHEAHEWTSSLLIVDTIVPWTAEWLVHYELWKVDGHWYGDGGQDNDGISGATPMLLEGDRPEGRADRRRRVREEARHGPGANERIDGLERTTDRAGSPGMRHIRPTVHQNGVAVHAERAITLE